MKHRTVENNGWDRQPQSDLNRVLFERLPMGVCAVDNLGQVVMLNSTGTRLLGWRESLKFLLRKKMIM